MVSEEISHEIQSSSEYTFYSCILWELRNKCCREQVCSVWTAVEAGGGKDDGSGHAVVSMRGTVCIATMVQSGWVPQQGAYL
ncbi:hypothetical protein DPMN_143992 [Dreissena polymorpha]|uniref:Uncharacterized protein n=1 Tax=Dreissena polymorpha TaxID=45954 RepID=A0A9D4GH86_DREPO|nr:hypothetical protein DPMN_143979 [Dreissena polymorpha]KAH3815469.1 hypothetical protein DPMN_143992 [Dreissena polymorpha]